MKFTATFVILILSSFSAPRCGATVYHSDGSAVNVQLIHDIQAIDGDTITLPAGTFTWTTGVNITKAITLQGQTTTDIVFDSVQGKWVNHGVDATILLDNMSRGDVAFIESSRTANNLMRITGITFKGLATTQALGPALRFGSSVITQLRIDHCHFIGSLAFLDYVGVYANIRGVMDHVVVDGFSGGEHRGQNLCQNGDSPNGDGAWTQPMNWGSADFFFEEDCLLDSSGSSVGGGWDSENGGKYVIRHCHLYDIEILNHGTEQGRRRGGRGYELYNNDYYWSYEGVMDGIRSGSMIAHDNRFFGVKPRGWALQNYRSFFSWPPWSGATGDNPWDLNATEPDGTHVDGHPPYLFQSGTVSSGSAYSLTDATKNWTPNQWVGFNVKRLSDNFNAYVISNTSNTMTFFNWGGPPINWTAGQQYQVHKVLAALDQPTRGQGDLLVGDNPPAAWPHQLRDPCYSWNNVYQSDGSTINFVVEIIPPLAQGLDYFNDTPLPGYTPYTYPHPLVIGGSSTPTPTPSFTPLPTPTATVTSTPTPTATPAATATFTPTPTPTATATVPPSPTPIPSPTSTPTPTPVPGGTNVALAANGGVASASSTYNNNYPVTAVNDGDRLGLNWGNGGGWNDGTPNVWPDWVEIDFNASYPINEIDFFTLQDNYQNPSPPTLDMTFTLYGVTDFEVQYWTGSTWTDIPGGGVTGNDHVWRQFTFANITTAKIRVLINNSLATYSRVTEIEAYRAGANPTPTPTPTATATPTPTPTPDQCEVPNFIGIRIRDAQSVWNDAGFTTEVITSENGGGHLIMSQSLPEGFIGSCSDTTIIVE